jgi:pimeloyl-ACP methyl ester carboxylesterase
MATFPSFDGVTISYTDDGDGPVLVLLHGFAADTNVNYVRPGLFDLFLDEGYRVITFDARGHGLSEKPREPEGYADDAMRHDVSALLDHLRIESCVLVGYSMGAHTSLRVAAREPRVKALVLLGIGENAERNADGAGDGGPGDENAGEDRRAAMIAALTTEDPEEIEASGLRRFRVMAGNDRTPLIAYMSTPAGGERTNLDDITVPVLLVVGESDVEAGDPTGLAQRLDAQLVRVPGDHFQANAHPQLHRAVLDFLATA